MTNKTFMKSLLIFLTILCTSVANEATFEEVAKVDGGVWGIDCVDSKNMIFTLKDGRVGLLHLQSKKINYLKNTPKDIFLKGQGGLMDVALSPDFEKNKEIYFTYAKAISNHGATTLAVAKLQGDTLKDWRDLLVTDSLSNSVIHFGSRITFDSKYLYFGVGDRGSRESAQDLKTHKGKILRLHLDGSIPKENPFFQRTDNTKKEIYSYGHRNPQGLMYDSTTSKLYSNEHGPRGGDEINIIQAGKNYGWPIASFGREYHNNQKIGVEKKNGIENPIKIYIPSIAPSSLIIYHNEKYKFLQGSILSTALKITSSTTSLIVKNIF